MDTQSLTERQPSVTTRTTLFLASAVTALSLALALPRAASTPQFTDGAEYAAAAVTGSLVHPPGYPLYSYLAEVSTLLNPDNSYAAVASLSAGLQALAAAVTLAAFLALTGRILPSVILALVWALSRPALTVATDAEVFALHNALSASVILCGVHCARRSKSGIRGPLVLGLVWGLSLSHHHLGILWLPFVGACLLAAGRRTVRSPTAVLGAAFLGGMIGFAPVLLLPVRFAAAPELAFGAVRNAVELLAYLLRAGYGTFSLTEASLGPTVPYLGHFLLLCAVSVPVVVAGACFAPFIAGTDRDRWIRPIAWGLLLSCLLHCLFLWRVQLTPEDVRWSHIVLRFYSPALLSIVAAAALPLAAAAQRQPLLLGVTLLFPFGLTLGNSLESADARADRTVQYELNEILGETPENSLFLADDDRIVFGLQYRQRVFKERPDLIVVARGMLASNHHLAALRAAYPAMSAFEDQAPVKDSELARFALESGLPVFSHVQAPPLEGFVGIPLGVVIRWLPEEALPLVEPEAVDSELLRFCLRLPEMLLDLPRGRTHSRLVLKESFIDPLRAEPPFFERFGDSPRQAAAAQLEAGNLQAARTICLDALGTYPSRTEGATNSESLDSSALTPGGPS